VKASPRKIRAARLSVAVAAALAIVKLATGILTGSMAVLSSAVDSSLDILMSSINFMAIRQADQPADENHPFGHGKFETIATIFQSMIIAFSGLWIIYEASRRLWQGAELSRLGGGMAILAISSVASWLIASHLRRVARETDSSALHADSLHFSMDVYTNLALVAGLAIVAFFGIPWLDPLLSIGVAVYILYEALRLLRYGARDILDEELPPPIRQEIVNLIEAHREDLLGFHNLRTRRAGSQKIMDFHLTVCKHLTVEEAHAIADELEKKIEREIIGADVTIHIEPCRKDNCPGLAACPADKTRLAEQEDCATDGAAPKR
jgi:ferrous-iron efflux pump FieF